MLNEEKKNDDCFQINNGWDEASSIFKQIFKRNLYFVIIEINELKILLEDLILTF